MALARLRNHLHSEKDAKVGEKLSEMILGGQDGLVNTLGVILGLAAASNDFRIVVAGGLAGAIAEAVSMGAVGYTSLLAERDFYFSSLGKENMEIDEVPELEREEIRDLYERKGFKGKLLNDVVKVITSDRQVWLETMMREELKLRPVELSKPLKSSIVIGVTSFLGAVIPLVPFLIYYWLGVKGDGTMGAAMLIALSISALALFAVGAVKARLTIGKWYRSGAQMMLIGILSALAGYVIGSMFSV